jgi:two-component system, OmpR family, alkaline phosphatase synthesis response regulator PhoP
MASLNNQIVLIADATITEKDLLKSTFRQDNTDIHFVEDGKEVIAAVAQFRPSVLILEVVLPNIDGIEICSELRKREDCKDLLIIFVSDKSEDFIQIAALDAGGDDYLLKPIRPRLLFSHIKAFQRRIENITPQIIVETKTVAKTADTIHPILDIDEVKRCAYVHGKIVNLPRKQFDLLALLLSSPGKVFARQTLLDTLWEGEKSINERIIDVHIRKLRKIIGNDFIVTFKGMGYKVVY